MTSQGIYKHHGFPDYQALRAGCDCGNPEHDHNIYILVEEDFPFVIVSIESDVEHCNYGVENNGNVFQKLWSRLKSATQVLSTGRLKVSQSFYFGSEEQVRNYTAAINESYDRIKLQLPPVRKIAGNGED